MQPSKHLLVDLQHINLRREKRVVLQHVNLQIKPGEIVTVIGPNGAGKTNLIKIVLGLIKPSSGTVTIHKGLRIGYMPQKINVEFLMPLTVRRFLLLSPRATEQKCLHVATELGIVGILQTPIQSVSGGELQRVLLARALLNDPELLVLDEPAQGIDINGQANLYKLIVGFRAKLGCSILMVSHDLHLVIAGTDQVVCLNKHICCSGSPAKVTQDPEFIHLFGTEVANSLAIYTHHHDHQHDL